MNRGNLTAITYADNSRELFAYDAGGNVVSSTNRRGGVITFAYNTAGQLTSKDYAETPGITDFAYDYDSAGNLTNATYWNPQLSAYERPWPGLSKAPVFSPALPLLTSPRPSVGGGPVVMRRHHCRVGRQRSLLCAPRVDRPRSTASQREDRH